MKSLGNGLLFTLLLTQIFSAQSVSPSAIPGGWIWQNPLPWGNSIIGVSFVSEDIGTVVGTNGTILRTTDGGESWIAQESGTDLTLWGVSFVDINNGTAVGDLGIILRTTNGGIPGLNRPADHWKLYILSLSLMQMLEQQLVISRRFSERQMAVKPG